VGALDTAITVTTKRLVLRTMRAEDATPLHALFGDPEFMRAFDAAPFTPPQTDAWVARNLAHQAKHGFGLFTVVHGETGDVIGDCGFEMMSLDGATEIELGYDLARAYWGRGLAREAAGAAAAYAFDTLGLDHLVSLVRAGNARSLRVAEAIGMRRVAEIERDGIAYSQLRLDSPRPREKA
jgi:ribosomal-protein-alanine N-acetyltransferase